MLSSWFEVFLDNRAETLQNKTSQTRAKSENEMNNSLAAKLHQVEKGLSTKHATKWMCWLLIRFIVVYHVYIDV